MCHNPVDPAWEPVELIVLKQKLAKLTASICKCLTYRHGYETPVTLSEISPHDKKVQVEMQPVRTFDRFTQACQASIRKDREDLIDSLTKDVLCPCCFVTMSLLRGRSLQVLKDEISETNNDMFSCDKATEKIVKSVEKTTSFTSKPSKMYANLAVKDSSDSESSFKPEVAEMRDNSPHVKFTSPVDSPPCFCLKRFMDSIRPPIIDCYA